MHKEIVAAGNNSTTEKNIFDATDIEFLESDGAYLTQEELADYFKIHVNTFYNITRRQPEALVAYQKAKTLKKLSYHRLADDKIFGKVTEGDTSLLIFQLKTRCRMAEILPESRVEDQIVETPEEKATRMEKIKEYTEYLNDTEWHAKKAKQLVGETK